MRLRCWEAHCGNGCGVQETEVTRVHPGVDAEVVRTALVLELFK